MTWRLPDPAIRYAVIGDPVAHSVSPAMQNAAFEAAGLPERYGKLPVKPDELADFCEFARRHLAGFNATLPHKHALLPYLDKISAEAREAGSVNTVTVCDGRLCGDSTDGYGLATALHEAFGIAPAGGTMLLLGAGGAARAAAFALARRGAAKLVIVNRTLFHAETLAAELQNVFALAVTAVATADEESIRRHAAASSVVIQATSSGLKPTDVPPVRPESLADCRAYLDMIYCETPLLKAMQKRGIPAADGRLMLLHQGAKSWSLWTGKNAPIGAMRKALAAALPQ